jgi:hypothetical protein
MTGMAALGQGTGDARAWAVRPVVALTPFAVAIACSLLFLAASWAATFADRTAIRTHVAAALGSKTWRPYRNDCLVAYMLLARYDSRVEEVLFPKIPQGDNPCGDLRNLLHDPAEQESWTYQRYLLGERTIVAPLLSHLEVRDAGRFLLVASYALILAAVAALVRRRRQRGSAVRNAPIDVGLVLPASMLLFYVTPNMERRLPSPLPIWRSTPCWPQRHSSILRACRLGRPSRWRRCSGPRSLILSC